MKDIELDPNIAMNELHGMLVRLQAEGAIDEEVPFIQNLITQVNKGLISSIEALDRAQKKVRTRGDYH